MTRQLRLEYEGSLWHITQRGIEKRSMYLDDADRRHFVDRLGETAERFRWKLTDYTLMGNHYHLCVELTRPGTLSRGMQWLEGPYTAYFNKRHQRVGTLVQGRFKGILVENDRYFQNVSRYVVLNPVRAAMCKLPDQYKWSSYRAHAGLRKAPPWLASDEVVGHFGSQTSYVDFVSNGYGDNPWKDLIAGMFLGSEEWVERIRHRVRERPRDSEIPREQRLIGQPSMVKVVNAVASTLGIEPDEIRNGRGGNARMITAWLGFHEALLRNQEIAAGLRFNSSGHVTRLVRRCDRELSQNESLRILADWCVSTLRGVKYEGKI